jgi:hypothetical protein
MFHFIAFSNALSDELGANITGKLLNIVSIRVCCIVQIFTILIGFSLAYFGKILGIHSSISIF